MSNGNRVIRTLLLMAAIFHVAMDSLLFDAKESMGSLLSPRYLSAPPVLEMKMREGRMKYECHCRT